MRNEYAGFCLTASNSDGVDQPPAVPRVVLDDITPERFFAEFISQRRPCVLVGHPRSATDVAKVRSDEDGPSAHSSVSDGAPKSAKRAKVEVPAAVTARWDWPDEMLERVAGDTEVDVEIDDAAKTGRVRRFGHGRKQRMRFADFVSRVREGDESLYLTTQAVPEDSEGRPRLCTAPAEQLLLGGHAPLRVPLMGNLVLSQINVWMGKSRAGASSGCHHDFHDNLYVLVRGKKLFHLWSPDGADAMATAGTITRIHPNGRICYRGEEHIAADGSWPEESERDGRDGDAENDHNGDEANDEDDDDDGGSALALALGPAESDDSDDDMLESALEAALDGSIPGDDYQEDCEEEEEEEEVCRDDDDDDGVTKDARDGIPKSFSVLDTADDADMTTPLQDRFRKTPSVTVTLEAGDSLYLPAGWFHEVHSQDDTSGRGHVALNYWYHPPIVPGDGALDSPYAKSNFWLREWRRLCETDPVVRQLIASDGNK